MMNYRIAGFALLFAAAADGQPAVARFEVASIKPSPTAPAGPWGINTGNGRLTVVHETLKRCIQGAFAVGPNQIVGGPPWLESDRFDIAAKAEQPVGDRALMGMLQVLLVERFELAVHRESRTIQAYVLEVAKKGHKLEKSGGGGASTQNSRGLINAKSITMARFAEVLSRQMDLPVMDETGLDGTYDLSFSGLRRARNP